MLRADSRLELELEELRRDRDRLKREESVWRSRAELSEKKALRFAQDLEQAQSEAQRLERDVLALKQQNQQLDIKHKRSINDLEEQFSAEREALEEALQATERRLEEARTMERQQTLRVAACEKQLVLFQNTPIKKRARHSFMQEEEEEDGESEESDLVFDLRLKIRELEANNLALSKGVAVTQRTQQLAEDLANKERECRKLAEELAAFKSARALALERESEAELYKMELDALKARQASLTEFAAMKDSVMKELAQWKRVLPGGAETPAQASRVFADFEAEFARVSSARQEAEANAKALVKEMDCLEQNLRTREETVRALETKLAQMEQRARQMELERVATENVLSRVPLVAGELSTSGDKDADSQMVAAFQTEALNKAREELRLAQLENERLMREIQTSIGTHAAFDASKTRVLHIKHSQRADRPLPAAAATATTTATATRTQALLRTPAPAAPHSAIMPVVVATPEGFSVDKHNARLKEMFQKQIRMFKLAVFLMFGWKIEMTPDESRPVLKLKSMFAESPDDVLMFRMDTATSQLDLLGSEYAKTLDPTVLAYLHRFQSPPGFISYLTLDLFNRQTRM